MTPTLLEWRKLQEDALCAESLKRHKFESRAEAHAKASSQLDYEQSYSELRITRQRKPHVWITINPRPGTSIEELELALIAPFEKYFEWYVYTLEIRKAPDEGMHAHCLAKIKEQYQNRNFSRFKEPFMGICGNLKHIDIKYPTEEDLLKVFQYLTKAYTAKSKRAANTATQEWREANGVLPLYSAGDLPTCLVPPTDLIKLT